MKAFNLTILCNLRIVVRTEQKLYYHPSLTKTYEDMANYNRTTWHDKLQCSIQLNI